MEVYTAYRRRVSSLKTDGMPPAYGRLDLTGSETLDDCMNGQPRLEVTYISEYMYVMNTKLTLRMDESLVEKGKFEAGRRGRSVSQMVGDFFDSLRMNGPTRCPGDSSWHCSCVPSPQVRVLWFLALSLVLLPLPVGATSVLSLSFDSLVEEAEVIAVGTVTAIESAWDGDNNVPHTFVTFSNLEVLKGEADQTELTLRFFGGPTPDGGVAQIAGVPQFTLQERAVIFSVGNNHQAVPLVGIWQGVYRVVYDAERGVDTIRDHAGRPVTALPTEDGEILHDHAEDGGILHDHDTSHGVAQAAQMEATSEVLTLSTLIEQVEEVLEASEEAN